MLRARTWRWLRVRIAALLDDPKTRLARAVNPQPEPEPEEVDRWRSS